MYKIIIHTRDVLHNLQTSIFFLNVTKLTTVMSIYVRTNLYVQSMYTYSTYIYKSRRSKILLQKNIEINVL